ncbi:MAG: pyridoxamine 5'-phosphate oxidase family protein [Sphingomonadales bacterium]
MSAPNDHEVVSIYPYTPEQLDRLLTDARECVLMWATKDSWPVGVYHSFVWRNGRIWITFGAHRHRANAIKRNPKVSVAISGVAGVEPDCPMGSATCKGIGIFHDDEETKAWFYRALADKSHRNDKAKADRFVETLNSPMRTILEVIPTQWITFDSAKSARHMAGEMNDNELGPRLSSDANRLNKFRAERGLGER